MRDARLVILGGKLLEVAAHTSRPQPGGLPSGTFIALRGPGFVLGDEATELYEAFLREVLEKDGWGLKYSESVVQTRLFHALTAIVDDPTIGVAKAELAAIAKDIEAYSTTQSVYLPLVGVEVDGAGLDLGNVRLVTITPEVRTALLNAAEAVIATMKGGEKARLGFRSSFEADVHESLTGQAASVYKVVAEPQRAFQRAEEETRRVLELLRFAIPALHSLKRMQIGLAGEAMLARRPRFLVSEQNVNFGREAVGALHPFALNAETATELRRLGVLELSELLRRPRSALTDFEFALLRAVHWFSNAQRAGELDTRFQSLMTCLEAMLTPKDSAPIGHAIGEGMALIIGASLNDRRLIKRRVKHFYGVRSGLSHGGAKAVLEEDYRELELLAGTLLVVLIRSKGRFRAREGLLEALEEMRLSGAPFPGAEPQPSTGSTFVDQEGGKGA